jgi:hypothetical protein
MAATVTMRNGLEAEGPREEHQHAEADDADGAAQRELHAPPPPDLPNDRNQFVVHGFLFWRN